MKKNIVLWVVMLLCGATAPAFAQDCIGFTPAVSRGMNGLSEKTLSMLQSKVKAIIAHANAGQTALYNAFVVYPELNVTETGRAETGMQTITVIKAELSLFAGNLLDNSTYGSVTMDITGSGNSEAAAYASLIQNIKVKDPQFVRFLKNAQAKITEYYTNNCPVVLKKVQTLVSQDEYEQALAFLSSIPVCVPCYDKVSGAAADIFKTYSDKKCQELLLAAQGAYATGDFTGAVTLASQVSSKSQCVAEAKALLDQIKAKVDKDNDQAIELKKYETEAVKEIAKAYLSQKTENHYIVK